MRRVAILGFLFTILMATSAYAGTYAVVTGSRVNVRSYADIGTDNRLFQVDRGSFIEVHGVYGDFLQATIQGESGVYIAREFVAFRQTEGTVTAMSWMYTLPAEAGGTAVAPLYAGNTVTVTSTYSRWYGVVLNDTTVFVPMSAVEIPCFVELPTARLGNSPGDLIVETAMNYLGTRYQWGGTTPNGFDCSGFMVYLFSPHGVSLNRRSRDMARNGTEVSRGELAPGDLLFFGSGGLGGINHVGLYMGGGQFIHSSSDRTGGVIISNLGAHYNERTFTTARRVI
ncbi:MAG: C40 family peptidase [Defluviitaleaceae bacterium]|nr:C40 family peptidase [Defluviitaleaceae bacterium]